MYSEQETLISAEISGLNLYPSPLKDENTNRVWLGSIGFTKPLSDTGKQVIKGIRLLDFQLEELVAKSHLSSDRELAKILSPMIYGNSMVNLILHKRIVGSTYINPKTDKEFIVHPSKEYELGDKIYQIEIDWESPIILSDRAVNVLNQSFVASMVKAEEIASNKAMSLFEERRKARLELIERRKSGSGNPELPKTNVNEQLEKDLERLKAIQKPTAKEKARIAELESLLGAE